MRTLLLLTLVFGIAISQAPDNWVQFYYRFYENEYKDLDGWVMTQTKSVLPKDYFYTCGRSNMVLGGPLAFGNGATLSKTFKLPAHYQLRIQVQLWKFNTWAQKRMIMLADGFQWEAIWGADGTAGVCAKGNIASFNVDLVIPHDQLSLALLFTSTLTETNPMLSSWAIKKVMISYLACPAECGVCNGADPTKCSMWTPAYWTGFNMDVPLDWQVAGGKADIMTCSGIPFYGGYGNLGTKGEIKKIISGLRPHYKLKIQFQFWKIDNWDNEQAQLYVDRKLSWSQNFAFSEGVELCNGANSDVPEKIVNVNQEVPHTFDAVNLRFTSNLQGDAYKSSWGVRQVFVYVAKCPDNCSECNGPLPGDCTYCTPPFVMVDGACADPGNWILILRDFDNEKFSKTANWVVENAHQGNNIDAVSDCGGTQLFGGFALFGKDATAKRVFKEIPAHKRARIQFELWKIDAWDGEIFTATVDGVKAFEQIFGWSDPGSYDLCGNDDNPFNEKKMRVDIIVNHKTPTLDLVLSSNLQTEATTSSWAIRDFSIWYEAADACATLFTECNYQGKQYDLCDEVSNFSVEKYPAVVKSVQVPKDTTLILFDETEFGGQRVQFTANEPCIETMTFSLAQFRNHQNPQVENQKITHNNKKLKANN